MTWNRKGKFEFSQNKDNIIIGFLILLVIISLLSFGSGKSTYFLTNGLKSETPDLNQFCVSFIEQIIHKQLHKEMVESDIYDVLVESNYKVLNLVGNETPLFSRVKNKDCAVIIRDQLGLRRFEISVNSSFENPFYYKVRRVDEPLVEG